MIDEMAKLGLDAPTVVSTDLGQEHGQQATRRLLSKPNRPTALIYDNDVMAAVGLGVADEMGVEVPGDVSIVAWDNSLLSQLSRPPLTSTSVQVHQYSITVVEALLELIDGGHPESGQFGEAGLSVRGSTARPRPAPRR
jgi:DNA-binding LacI/PurR family transcriptional regulator